MGSFLSGVPIIGDFIEGVMNRDATRQANYENRVQDDKNFDRNAALQKEFAQHGLRWKIEDAKRAGISPLAALGAGGAAFAPVSMGSSGQPETLSTNFGQNVSRAIAATSTAEEKELQKLSLASARLDLEGKSLDNQYRLAQLNRLNSSGVAFPGSQNFVAGQGDSGLIKSKAMERTATRPGSPHLEPGAIPGVGYEVLGSGGLVPTPSAGLKEKIEDNLFHEAAHFFRNNLMPNFANLAYFGGENSKPPREVLPKGYDRWEWSFGEQAWVPVRKKWSDRYFRKGWWK